MADTVFHVKDEIYHLSESQDTVISQKHDPTDAGVSQTDANNCL